MYEIYYYATKWGFTVLAGIYGQFDTYADCQLGMLQYGKQVSIERNVPIPETAWSHEGIKMKIDGVKLRVTCRELES